MGLVLRLPAHLTCPHCGSKAHLVEGLLTRDIGQGIDVTVDSVPVYRCESCLRETMEIISAGEIEEFLAPFFANAQPNKRVRVRIEWKKTKELPRVQETVFSSAKAELLTFS